MRKLAAVCGPGSFQSKSSRALVCSVADDEAGVVALFDVEGGGKWRRLNSSRAIMLTAFRRDRSSVATAIASAGDKLFMPPVVIDSTPFHIADNFDLLTIEALHTTAPSPGDVATLRSCNLCSVPLSLFPSCPLCILLALEIPIIGYPVRPFGALWRNDTWPNHTMSCPYLRVREGCGDSH